jgi:hypothetical protein
MPRRERSPQRPGSTHPEPQGEAKSRPASQPQSQEGGPSSARRMTGPTDESGALLPEDRMTPSDQDRPTDDKIRLRAYERYVERQGRGGTPEDDWYQAEREVRSSFWSGKAEPGPDGYFRF